MLESGNALRRGQVVHGDVCIVGTGAAGLTLALEFLGSGRKVVLVESGSFAPPETPPPSHRFKTSHLPIAEDSRRRAFGGTTGAWAGRWKPHDPIDFAEREWLPASGWPLGPGALAPYYERAGARHGVRGLADPAPLLPASALGDGCLEPVAFSFQPPERRHWGDAHRAALERSAEVEVYLDAHALKLERRGRAVASVSAVSARGAPFEVRASYVVLACGGIENPRLMLLSDVGNDADQVGRHYMDHPKGVCGRFRAERGALPVAAYQRQIASTGLMLLGYRVSDRLQRERRILNSHVFVRLVPPAEGGSADGPHLFELRNYLEQAPRPDNRVRLDPEVDEHGLRRARVEWRLGPLDVTTMVVFHGLLREGLRRAGLGELSSPIADGSGLEEFPITGDASHHMGTTRMGDDPASSVVDRDCRVHGMANLFVAGSSVFPTGGYSNPMATLAALAIRLADHLKGLAF